MKQLATEPTLTKPVATDWLERHAKPIIVLMIIACMAGVSLLSYFVLDHASLRLDESQSLWQTSHSIGDTLRVVAQDVHVPLYHIILHFWQLYFGHGIPTTRLLSLIFFLVTIPLVYLLARQVLTIGWALFAMVVFSFAPFMDWYANETRMYTMLAMMATISQLYFLRIMQRKKFAWRGFGISALIGAYTHYFFSFNLAADGIFFLATRKRFGAGSFKRFFGIGLLVVIALLPWLIYFHALGSAQNTAPHLVRPSTVDFFNAFSQFLFGFQDNYINTILVSCWPLVVLAAFFGIKRNQNLTPEISYLLTSAFVPVIIAYALSFIVSPFYLSRYMISCVAPLIIVIVWLISHYGKRLARTAAAIILIVLVATSIQQYGSAATPVKEDYKEVAQTLTAKAHAQDVVVISAPFTIYPIEYYYNGPAQMLTLPNWNRQAAGGIPAFNAKTLPTQVASSNANHHYVYLVLSQNQGYESTIKQYYLHHFKEISQHTYSPDLSLYVFQVGYDQVPALGSAQTIIKPQTP